MTTIGLHKVVGKMFHGPMTLTEITKATGLKKPTVHYHMQNLIEQGIVNYDKKKGTYSVKINAELKKEILESLKTRKSLEALSSDLKEKAKKETKKDSPLNLLVRDKELTKKLNDILEILFIDEFVTVTEEHTLSGTTFKTEEHWTLTWKGCLEVGICNVCRESIVPSVSGMIAHTIEAKGSDFDIYHAPLIHPQCVSQASSEYTWHVTTEYTFEGDLCNYCGLPLSEKRLREWLQGDLEKSGFQYIYDLLTLDEINALNEERKKELIQQFKERYRHGHTKNTFEGDLLTKNKFNDEKFGEFVPKNEPYNFLEKPRLSDIEKLLKIIEKNSKKIPDLHDRTKDLFQAWDDAYRNAEEKLDNLIQSLFSNPAAMIYPKIWHTLPSPHDVATGRERPYEIGGHQLSHGYAFVIKDDKGKTYHENCFHSFSKLNQSQIMSGGKKQ